MKTLRLRRLRVALVAAVTLPGLLVVEPVASSAPSQRQAFEGRPPILSLPVPRPVIPTSAPATDGTLSVPADWASARPGKARRAVTDLPRPVTELTQRRDAMTEVWQNDDGTQTVTIHGEPMHFRRPGSASWEKIDNTLAADPERPGWVRNAANGWTVRFGPVGPAGAGGVELVTDAGIVRFAPELAPGATPVNPVVGTGDHANTTTYPGVWPGVDLVYSVSGGSLRADVVVRGAGRDRFPFVTEGLDLVAGKESVAVTGTQAKRIGLLAPEALADGAPAATVPRLSVEAVARGAAVDSAAAPGGPQRLVVAADKAWLDRAPTTVDSGAVVLSSTVVIGNSIHQSYKSDGATASQDGIRVGNSLGGANGGDSYWRSAAAFPYWDAIDGKQLLSAGIRLGLDQGAAAAQPVTAWWSCTPDYAGAICGGDTTRRYTTTQVTDAATLDVTDLVGLWQFFGTRDGTFGFSGANTPGSFTYKRFNPPALVLNVNVKPPAPGLVAPADGTLAITSTTPLLKWNPVTDPDGDQIRYTARIATGADAESGLVLSSPSGTATSWQVPAGVLRDGVTYYWKVFAGDGHAWTPSTIRKITVDRRLGAGATSPTDQFGGITANLVTGNASVQLPGTQLPTVGGGIGVGFAYNSLTGSGGLLGEYRVDQDRDKVIDGSDPVALVRADAALSFNWSVPVEGSQGLESTSPSPGVPSNWYSVRWQGFAALPAGQWQFGARSDDGVRVFVDGVNVLDRWDIRAMPAEPEFQTGAVTGNAVHRIKVEYFEADGGAGVELWARNAADPTQAFVVPAGWLSSEPRILPSGWSLQPSGGTTAYVRAEVSDGSVTLFAPDGAATSFAKTAFGLGYAPPPGVEDVVVVNGDGTVTVIAGDGRTYVFRSDGGLDKMTSALDDQHSASATSGYDPSGRLTALTDPVSGRSVTLTYAPNAACAERPPVVGGDAFGPTPAGMLCRVGYWDGSATELYYKNGLLGYVREPGDAYWGYSYDATGRLIGYHDPATFDAALTVRGDWDKLLVEIGYDGAGRVATITQPPANQGDARSSRTYAYSPATNANGELTGGTATVTHAGVTGVSRTVSYDGRGRGTRDANAVGQAVTTSWNADDQPTAIQDATQQKSTTGYDAWDQPTDRWGPAPATMFNADGTGQSGVPRQVTRYDEGLDGLAVRWWSTVDQSGIPVLHGHDPGSLSSDWGTGSPGTGVPSDNFSGRYTGKILFPAAGTYTLRFVRDNKLAVYLDDVVHLARWENTTSAADDVTVTVTAANTVRRLRIDYADVTGPAKLQMLWKAPGSSSFVPVPGTSLRTGQSLPTSTVDAAGRATSAGYTDAATGIGAQHGVAVTMRTDPGGANLTSTTRYETVGTGYLRELSQTPPAGDAATASATYYGPAETRDNPCTAAADPAVQAGLGKLDTGPDPDGSGPQSALVRERVYDPAGRVVATKVGSEPWTCTAYDARGQVTRVDHPAYGAQPARTVTYDYRADPDGSGPRAASPLVSAISDPAGTVVTEQDLLGRTIAHRDVFGNTTTFGYDLAGRQTTGVGPAGTIEKSYDAADQLISVKRNGSVLAEGLTYDGVGRPTGVSYPSGTGRAGNGTTGMFAYDPLGRPGKITWTGPGGTLLTSDEVSRDATGNVTGQLVDGVDHHAGDDYRYDSAGRLVEAWVPGAEYTYEFFENGFCTAPGSYRNGNRTTMAVTPTGGSPVSTAYCYDNADRLYGATDPAVGTVTYDSHGNVTQIFGETHTYDAADRHVATAKGSSTVSYVRDALDRIVERRVNGAAVARYGYTGADDVPAFLTDGANVVQEVTYLLPGDVMLTTRSSGNVWSYPNIHGDVVATASQAGVKQGRTVVYDPFGSPVAGSVPDNAAGGFDFGWLGQHQRPLEHEAGLQPVIEMGARQYSPALGRFLEVDPVSDGSCNAYDYVCNDPVNALDLDGQQTVHRNCGWTSCSWYISVAKTRQISNRLSSWGGRLTISIAKNIICTVIGFLTVPIVGTLCKWIVRIGVWYVTRTFRNAKNKGHCFRASAGTRTSIGTTSPSSKYCDRK